MICARMSEGVYPVTVHAPVFSLGGSTDRHECDQSWVLRVRAIARVRLETRTLVLPNSNLPSPRATPSLQSTKPS